MYIQFVKDKDFPGKEELIALMEKSPKISPLLIAANAALWDSIPHLLAIAEINETINEKNQSGLMALHLAAMHGRVETFRLLRENGATTTDEELANWRDEKEYSLLMRAVLDGSIEGVRFLLDIPEVKKNINTGEVLDGEIACQTPLYLAVTRPKRAEIIKVLLASGAHVDTINLTYLEDRIRGEVATITIIEAAHGLIRMAQSQKYDPVEFNLFLNAGASVNQVALDYRQAALKYRTKEYISIFETALRYGNTEMLLAHFLDPIKRDLDVVDKLELEIKKIMEDEIKNPQKKKAIRRPLEGYLKAKMIGSAIEKTQAFLTWLKERDLSKAHRLTKSEIYFKIADLIANNIVLLCHENYGYKLVDKYLKKVKKNTPFYEAAQRKLIDIYLAQKAESDEEAEALLEEAFIHASEAGDDPEAVTLRKKLMKTALNTDLEIPGDPKNSSDLFRIFRMLGKRLAKASEDSVNSPAKRQKMKLEAEAKDKNVSPGNTLLLAYKNTPISDNKKHTLDPSERSDSESKKRRAESPTNIAI